MSTQTKSQNENIELGCLWSRSSVNNQQYLTGNLNLKGVGIDKQIPIVVFNNRFKTADNQPDLRIYLSKPKGGTVPPKKADKPKTAPTLESEPKVEEDNNVI